MQLARCRVRVARACISPLYRASVSPVTDVAWNFVTRCLHGSLLSCGKIVEAKKLDLTKFEQNLWLLLPVQGEGGPGCDCQRCRLQSNFPAPRACGRTYSKQGYNDINFFIATFDLLNNPRFNGVLDQLN